MIELQKYSIYAELVAIGSKGNGRYQQYEVYLSEPADAELQRLREELQQLHAANAEFSEANRLLRMAMEWCLENGAKRPMFRMKELYEAQRILNRHNEELEVPPKLAPIILGERV